MKVCNRLKEGKSFAWKTAGDIKMLPDTMCSFEAWVAILIVIEID